MVDLPHVYCLDSFRILILGCQVLEGMRAVARTINSHEQQFF